MDISIFLAKAWGLYLVIMTLVVFINRDAFKRIIKAIDDDGFLFLSGWLALIVGILTVLTHNIWQFDWRGLITLLGWSSLLKGVLRFLSPDLTKDWAKRFIHQGAGLWVWFLLMLATGLYLVYAGFFA